MDKKASLRAKWDSSIQVCLAVNASKRFDPSELSHTSPLSASKTIPESMRAFYNVRPHTQSIMQFLLSTQSLSSLSVSEALIQGKGLHFLPIYVNGYLLKQFRLNALFAAGYVNNISQPGFEPLTPLCSFFPQSIT